MLRERTGGTLERLMSMPMAKLDLLLGYGLAFAALGALQGVVAATVAFGLLGVESAGPEWAVVALAVANALLGMALGLFVSAFATTEFQAVQFMPAFLLPQILLCGLIAPRDVMAEWLDTIAGLLPMTYAYDGLSRVADGAGLEGRVLRDLGIVAGVALLSLALGAATLRRRTA
jgi:ABC-2 type transport system permease protein